MFKKLFLVTASAIGGIYLTSEEGKKTRQLLLKRKSTFEPIIKDLLEQTNQILDGSKDINSNEIKANIDMLVTEAKQTLVDIDLDKTTEIIKESIRVASKKIRIAINESEKENDIVMKKELSLKDKVKIKGKPTNNTISKRKTS